MRVKVPDATASFHYRKQRRKVLSFSCLRLYMYVCYVCLFFSFVGHVFMLIKLLHI